MKFCKDCKFCVLADSHSGKAKLTFATCANEKTASIPHADMKYLVSGEEGFLYCSLARNPVFKACGVTGEWFEPKSVEPKQTENMVHMRDMKHSGSKLRRWFYSHPWRR